MNVMSRKRGLKMLDDGELAGGGWTKAHKATSVEFDLSNELKCAELLPSAYLVEALCEMPKVEWIHVINKGHCGHDQDGFLWTWDDNSAKMVNPELDE